MGEGQEDQPRTDTSRTRLEEVVALSARVAALEQQVAGLRSLLATPAIAESMAVLASGTRIAEGASIAAADNAPVSVAEPGPALAPPPFAGVASAPASRESLEKRLGSQVFSRIGIIAMLIGATWFLKLAIDNQWIGPTGRILAGLTAGAGLVVWSERFRRKGFNAFSYTLKAVGSGVLYLSLWAAFQIYHLLPAGAALVAMLLVTAWNAYMAWAQDAQGLAAYALIGGCATPLLLSTGGNHETFLFTYLLAIVVASIALVRLRPWPRLLLGVFPATVAYFIGWYAENYTAEQLTTTSIFIVLFFLAFATVPLRSANPAVDPNAGQSPASDTKPKPRRTSLITEIFLPLGNAAFGSLAFYSVLQDSGLHSSLPWMVVLFAAFYLGLMRLPQSAAASAVHLSLGIVFLTIAIPLKASGHWITVSWLVEGAVLLWVSARLAAAGPAHDDSPVEAYRVLRTLAVAALLLGLAGLFFQMDSYRYSTLSAFWNHRYATALVGIVAFSLSAWIAFHARRNVGANSVPPASTLREQLFWLQIAGASIIAVNLIAILATVREIAALWQFSSADPEAELQQALAISAFLMVYGGVLLAVGFWKQTAFIRWQALLLILFTIGKTFLYDMRSLSQGYRVASFMALGALLLAVSFAYQKNWLALRGDEPTNPRPEETL